MFETQLIARDTQGSLVAVRANVDGALLSALDTFDVTLDTDLDSLNGTTIATNSGVAGAGTMRVVHVSDVAVSTQVQGIARTTNPTAVSDGADVRGSFDKVGRQITVPYQVRELVSTAYTSLTNGTEATLLASPAGAFSDLYMITMTNISTAALGTATAANIDVRSATGGGILFSATIPDDDTRSFKFNPPIPQNVAADTWTVDMNDITGTTVQISALFVQNV